MCDVIFNIMIVLYDLEGPWLDAFCDIVLAVALNWPPGLNFLD